MNPIRIQEKIVAVLHALLGLFLLVAVVLIWKAAADLATWFEGSFIPGLFAFIGRPLGVFFIVLALAEIAAAVGLLLRKGWARAALIAGSAALLLLIPIGTLVGAYSLFVLLWLPRNEGVKAPTIAQ